MQNAGVAFAPQPPNDLTKDGSFEAVYAGNYLGHFLLTELLLPTIKATPGARVSFTSSITHWGATFDLDDLLPDGDLARGRRKDDNVYQNSKLLQILHCFELQRRLRGTGVTLTPVAPGLIQTDIFDNDDKRKGGDFKTDVSWPMQSIEEGCKTNLHALLSPSMEGQEGYFLQPCTRPPLALEPRRPQTSFASTHSPRPSPDALASPMASPRPAFERTHASASLPPTWSRLLTQAPERAVFWRDGTVHSLRGASAAAHVGPPPLAAAPQRPPQGLRLQAVRQQQGRRRQVSVRGGAASLLTHRDRQPHCLSTHGCAFCGLCWRRPVAVGIFRCSRSALRAALENSHRG